MPTQFDLVNLGQACMQKPPFTHGGVKSSSKYDPLSYLEDFYSLFMQLMGLLPILFTFFIKLTKFNVPQNFGKLQSSPLKILLALKQLQG